MATRLSSGTITNPDSTSIYGASYGVLITGSPASVINAGSIASAPQHSYAVWLQAGGYVSNTSGGTITGTTGVYVGGATGTVINAGSITSTGLTRSYAPAAGVILQSGGTVTNAGDITGIHSYGVLSDSGGYIGNVSGGTIVGGYAAIRVIGAAGTLVNAGAIAGYTGVYFGAGGTISNVSGGSITGADAIVISGSGGTVTNAGSIASATKFAVWLQAGGTVSNASGGAITGATGVYVGGATGTVINAGSITSTGHYGPYVSAGGVILQSGGTVINAGDITATDGSGILSDSSAYFGNVAGGTISASNVGIHVSGGAGTVVNAGVIAGYTGVSFVAGGTISNVSGGTIIGSSLGIFVIGSAGIVLNAGSITGGFAAVALGASGYVSNTSGGTLTGGSGVYVVRSTGTVVNAGIIASTGLSHSYAQAAGVILQYGGTVINAGDITATHAWGISSGSGGYFGNVAGGTIAGGYAAIRVVGGAGTLVNAGVVAGNFSGVEFDAGGTVSNAHGGSISGTNGIYVTGSAGTVSNAGVITGRTFYGVNERLGGSVSNASGGTITATYRGVVVNDGIVVNAGVIAGGNDGVYLLAGGIITNVSGGSIAGRDGILGNLRAGTVVNAGVITGGTKGVYLNAGGTISNVSGGSITGTDAIFVRGSAGTVINAGGIASAARYAVWFQAGGYLSNTSSGTITGATGVYVGGATGTVINTGIITSTGVGGSSLQTSGVALQSGGTVSNASGGTITATDIGVFVNDDGTVTNAGDIAATNVTRIGIGILSGGGGYVGNVSGGTIAGGYGGIHVNGGAGTVVNAGVIAVFYSRYAYPSFGIFMAAGGTISNLSGGSIIGSTGIYVSGGAGTVVNAGVITGFFDYGVTTGHFDNGVDLLSGGTVSNASGGTITAASVGVFAYDGGTVVNAGVIAGGTIGVYSGGGGTISNASGGSITGRYGISVDGGWGIVVNGGVIAGYEIGVDFGAGGIISNVSGGLITATDAIAIAFRGAEGTVINAGSIKGTDAAVVFAEGHTNRLIIDPGASFSGTVDGGNVAGEGFSSTLELAGTSAATFSGLGTQFINFTRIVIDAGANWSLTDTLTSGVTLINAGTIGSVHLGSARFIQQGSATLDAPTLSGGAGSVFEVASNQTIHNLGSNFSNLGSIAIDTGVVWTMTGTNAIAAGTTLNNTGTIVLSNARLTNAGGLVNNGAIVIDPSSMTVGDLSGTGSVTIGSDSTLIVQGTISSGQTIVFADSTGILELDDSVAAAGTIDGFVTGDTITLGGVTDATAANIVNTNTLEVTRSGHSPIDLTLDPTQHFTGATFNVPTTGGNTVMTANDLACFAAGTRIATPDGPVPVEALREGNLVCTASGAPQAVRWIGFRHINLMRHPAPERARPIRIRANAIAAGKPNRDLRLSPDHAVLWEGALIPVKLLRNDATIVRDDECRSVTYYHVELDRHDILLAEDLPAESYLDTGNRGMFENALLPVLHADFTNSQYRREAESCAPFVDDPIASQRAWRGIVQRAAEMGYERPIMTPTTDDPLLYVTVAGRRCRPVCLTASRYVFILPTTTGSVSIMSRHAIPSTAQPWVSDERRLGVKVRQIALHRDTDELAIPMDHPMLSCGWWDVEYEKRSPMRWTDGAAVLDIPSGGPAVLEIDLDATLPYPLASVQDRHAAFAA